MEKQIIYGLYDLQDKCWMGNTGNGKEGRPNTYKDPEVARAAAVICARMMKYRPGRIMARPFEEPRTLKKKDTVDAIISCEEAIAELEKEGK